MSWGELWGVRMTVVTAMLLLATLVVVWRYTWHTARMVETLRGQVGAAREELAVSKEHVKLQRGELKISHKPFVVTDLSAELGYFAHNMGPGLAVNTYMVVPLDGENRAVTELGGLAPSQHATIDERHVRVLNEEQVRPHIIFSEGIFTRTDQWTATLNVVGDHRVVHRPASLTVPGTPCTLENMLERNWPSLLKALKDYRSEQSELATSHFIRGESEGN